MNDSRCRRAVRDPGQHLGADDGRDSFRTAARTVTESDLTAFVNLCGFNEPLFYDARHAAEGGYRGRLVPGAMSTRSVRAS